MRHLTYRTSATIAYMFGRAIETTPKLREAADAHVATLNEWGDFTRETFGRLYRPDDVARSAKPAHAQVPWAVKAHALLEQQASWREMQTASRSHRSVAADAAADLSAQLGKLLGLDQLPENEQAETPERIERDVRRLADEADAADAEGEADAAAELREAAEQRAKLWAKAIGRRKALEEKLSDPGIASTMRRVMGAVAERATEKAEAIAVLREAGFGKGSGGVDGDVPESLVQAALASELAREVLRILGAMLSTSRAADLRPIGQGHLDVVGITLGRDPTKLLASELARAAHPLGRVDVVERMTRKAALVREQRGEDRGERGDFVLLVDRSGSMEGERQQLARAAAMAMLMRAHSERRRVVLVMFDDDVSARVVVKPGDAAAAAAAGVALLLPAGGGTDAMKAATAARAMLSSDERKKVDTVIVTDGEWSVSHETAEALRRSGGTFNAVLVGDDATDRPEVLDRSWRISGSKDGGVAVVEVMR